MRVLVNGLSARTGGGLTYLASLLDAALAADAELRLELVLPGRDGPLVSLGVHDRVQIHAPFARPVPLPARLLWEQTRLPSLARRSGADVLFAPAELAPIRSPVPVVVGFQNPNLYARPCPFPFAQRCRLDALLHAARLSARNAAALVFVSEPFQREALAVLGVSPARAYVVSPGIHRSFHETGGHGLFDALRPFILSVSDVYAYKNFPFLVSAFARLRETRPDLRLVIAGRPVHTDAAAAIRERIRELDLEPAVVLLGGVPLRDMPSLYRSAECFVFPSLLESYGFPPLEAMACGVPVACSNASVMPEVCGDAAAYFDPTDVEDCARTLGNLLADAALRSTLVERGRLRAAALTWDGAGSALVRVLRDVAR
jgi:glycosyltransferase involved in cell wall biosynthesis